MGTSLSPDIGRQPSGGAILISYQARSSYSRTPAAPGQARAWAASCIREALGELAAEELLEDTAIVISELMTNALRAGCELTHLELLIDSQRVRVAVTDSAAGQPELVSAGPEDDHGRGLRIVSSLATSWGVAPIDGSKSVWADLPVQRRAS